MCCWAGVSTYRIYGHLQSTAVVDRDAEGESVKLWRLWEEESRCSGKLVTILHEEVILTTTP